MATLASLRPTVPRALRRAARPAAVSPLAILLLVVALAGVAWTLLGAATASPAAPTSPATSPTAQRPAARRSPVHRRPDPRSDDLVVGPPLRREPSRGRQPPRCLPHPDRPSRGRRHQDPVREDPAHHDPASDLGRDDPGLSDHDQPDDRRVGLLGTRGHAALRRRGGALGARHLPRLGLRPVRDRDRHRDDRGRRPRQHRWRAGRLARRGRRLSGPPERELRSAYRRGPQQLERRHLAVGRSRRGDPRDAVADGQRGARGGRAADGPGRPDLPRRVRPAGDAADHQRLAEDPPRDPAGALRVDDRVRAVQPRGAGPPQRLGQPAHGGRHERPARPGDRLCAALAPAAVRPYPGRPLGPRTAADRG